jgi:hypothetical protein
MISHNYCFNNFVTHVKEKEIGEILSLAHQECYEAERKMSGGTRGAPKARQEGCPKYVSLLKGLIFFLGNAVKPSGIADWEFQMYKPIVENLVMKEVMKADLWLSFFNDKWADNHGR